MHPPHVLVVKHGALGDVVRTSYFARALKEQRRGDLRLSWITAPNAVDLLRFNPYVDDLWTSFDAARNFNFTRVYSLDDELEALQGISRLTTDFVTGAYLNEDGQPTYSADSAAWFDMGLLSRFGKRRADELKKSNARTHAEIFRKIFGVERVVPELYGGPTSGEAPDNIVLQGALNIGINAGAGDRWFSKALPRQETIRTVQGLKTLARDLGRDIRIVLTGAGPDLQSNLGIAAEIGDPSVAAANTEESVLRFAALIGRLDYLITSDSLAMHLAIAQRVPFLAFFSPTSAAEIDDFGMGRKVVSLAADYCSYRRDADNSTVTAVRLLEAFREHAAALRLL